MKKSSEQNEHSDTTLQFQCKMLRSICDVLFVLLILLFINNFANHSLVPIVGGPSSPELILGEPVVEGVIIDNIPIATEIVLIITELSVWLLYSALIFQFRQMFVGYARVAIFSIEKIVRLRYIGVTVLLAELAGIMKNLALYFLLPAPILPPEFQALPPQEMITPVISTFVSINIISLLLGIGLIVLSTIMKRAVALEHDARLTI